MFVPVILSDAAAKKVPNKAAWATAIAFTTNIAFFPFLALRAAPEPITADQAAAAAAAKSSSGSSSSKRSRAARPAPGGTQAVGVWGRATGGICLALCGLSAAFAFYGRPEAAGGLAERAAWFSEEISSNRVFW